MSEGLSRTAAVRLWDRIPRAYKKRREPAVTVSRENGWNVGTLLISDSWAGVRKIERILDDRVVLVYRKGHRRIERWPTMTFPSDVRLADYGTTGDI